MEPVVSERTFEYLYGFLRKFEVISVNPLIKEVFKDLHQDLHIL